MRIVRISGNNLRIGEAIYEEMEIIRGHKWVERDIRPWGHGIKTSWKVNTFRCLWCNLRIQITKDDGGKTIVAWDSSGIGSWDYINIQESGCKRRKMEGAIG